MVQEVEIMKNHIERLESPRVALWLGFAVVPIAAGLDKFFYLLTDWSVYVSPLARALLPVEPRMFLYAVGLIEVAVGIAILTRWTVAASYVAAAWLLLIAANLVLAGFFDIAVRDLVLAVAAFTLARLTEVHRAAEALVAPAADATIVHRAA
jgi:hypothetical protein